MKVFIDPPNSLILFDLVERFGHEPLSTMAALQERIDNIEVDMPPMNVTLDDVVRGLKYAGIEVPSGVYLIAFSTRLIITCTINLASIFASSNSSSQ